MSRKVGSDQTGQDFQVSSLQYPVALFLPLANYKVLRLLQGGQTIRKSLDYYGMAILAMSPLVVAQSPPCLVAASGQVRPPHPQWEGAGGRGRRG